MNKFFTMQGVRFIFIVHKRLSINLVNVRKFSSKDTQRRPKLLCFAANFVAHPSNIKIKSVKNRKSKG
jgi:hypothetical protein